MIFLLSFLIVLNFITRARDSITIPSPIYFQISNFTVFNVTAYQALLFLKPSSLPLYHATTN